MSDAQVIQALTQAELTIGNDPAGIREIEAEIERISGIRTLCTRDFLVYRNQFRIKHAIHLQITRPKLLIGMINYVSYPNFQTLPLLLFGDIVSLAKPGTGKSRSDRLEFDIEYEDLSQAISRLPDGFTPDYYWDVQVCGGGLHPLGLEKLPFPAVAGFCHLYRGVNVAAAGQLYDCLAPLSADFEPHFKRQFPNKHILKVPFGANWGAFPFFDKDVSADRDIDLLISFAETDRIEYGEYRNKALQLARNFDIAHGDKYKVVFLSGVDKETYKQTLHRSKIGLNVCAFNGPYNYRSCEIMNSGALLLQMKIAFEGASQTMQDYFVAGKEFVEFTEQDMETVLLSLLENPAQRKSIAMAGQQRLRTEYNYKANHQKIYDAVRQITPEMLRHSREFNQDSFQLWINATYTAAPHHKEKRAVFAKLCASLDDFSSAEAIRYMLIGLPWLQQFFGARTSSVLANETLKTYLDHSLFSALEYLYFLIPTVLRTPFDTWTYQCYKSLYGRPKPEELRALALQLEQLQQRADLSDMVLPPFPLDFDVPSKDFDNKRKALVDMPYMTHAGNKDMQTRAMLKYMQWWVDYFEQRAENTTPEEQCVIGD